MNFFKGILENIKDIFNWPISVILSDFQRRKLLLEFHMFYDVNKDGTLEWKDLDLARQNICKLNGWKIGTEKHTQLYELFKELWRNLEDQGDEDFDGKITAEEWLHMWTGILKATREYERKRRKEGNKASNKKDDGDGEIEEERQEGSHIPAWFEKYMVYKFNLYDRAGDGYIDTEEFEYILSDGFEVPARDCRSAFTIFSQNNQKVVDMEYFRELALEYYLSDEPGALGNFINGQLQFDDDP